MGKALPRFLPQRGDGNARTLAPDGEHVATARLKQTGRLVLNAGEHLGTVWTRGCFVKTVLFLSSTSLQGSLGETASHTQRRPHMTAAPSTDRKQTSSENAEELM